MGFSGEIELDAWRTAAVRRGWDADSPLRRAVSPLGCKRGGKQYAELSCGAPFAGSEMEKRVARSHRQMRTVIEQAGRRGRSA